MKTGTPSAKTLQGAGSPPRSLRTCIAGHETCFPRECPVCAAIARGYHAATVRPLPRALKQPEPPAPPMPRGRRPFIYYQAGSKTMIAKDWAKELGCSIRWVRVVAARCATFPEAVRLILSRKAAKA
jgi:hypothetical protein